MSSKPTENKFTSADSTRLIALLTLLEASVAMKVDSTITGILFAIIIVVSTCYLAVDIWGRIVRSVRSFKRYR